MSCGYGIPRFQHRVHKSPLLAPVSTDGVSSHGRVVCITDGSEIPSLGLEKGKPIILTEFCCGLPRSLRQMPG
jgi:hypothetical protein